MKKRILYLFMTILVIVLGLISRQYLFNIDMPTYIGDILWGAMVYFGFRFLFTKAKLRISFILALLYSYITEFSQIYQGEWINSIRNTTFGALILGYNFSVLDLIFYTVGIIIAVLFDILVLKKIFKNQEEE
ncbi:DUF2809 domain-containing protein [uncultured Clostridium sp.]|uniref:ribosomal maturation YjgA family protein n=1 Tax=uncultured Clostridium sp. TaxID=59620 RepID=UPI0026350C06|nr:DUF2809 domain-containing protein [uncultured Clostridium sp.]